MPATKMNGNLFTSWLDKKARSLRNDRLMAYDISYTFSRGVLSLEAWSIGDTIVSKAL